MHYRYTWRTKNRKRARHIYGLTAREAVSLPENPEVLRRGRAEIILNVDAELKTAGDTVEHRRVASIRARVNGRKAVAVAEIYRTLVGGQYRNINP